jgi:hypothetical protein
LTEPLTEKYVKKLLGNKTGIEDALKRLDRLTQEEAQMAAAQVLEATHAVDDTGRVRGVADIAVGIENGVDRIERSWFPSRIHAGHVGSIILTENQLRQDLRKWLSPPDPSTNHNIACNVHQKGTATWFSEGRTYNEWKSSSESLLWIHGKRTPCSILPPDAT